MISIPDKPRVRCLLTAFFLALIFLALFRPAILAGAPPRELLVGVHRNFPPQYSLEKETGKPTGFAVEVMDEIARRTGLHIRYVIFNEWPAIEQALQDGRIDIIPNNGIIKERLETIAFTSPVEAFHIHIFIRETTPDIQDINDLKGKTVAVVANNKGASILETYGKAKPLIYQSLQEALLALLSGNADALIYPEPPVRLIASESGIDERIKTVGPPLLEVKRAIAVRKGETELRDTLDKAVKGFITTPEYRKIYAKWHQGPEPYWNVRRIVTYAALLVILVIVASALWHYVLLRRLNRDLKESVARKTEAQEALRESEERHRSIVQAAMDGVWIVDTRGRLLDVNGSYCRMSGYSEQELLAMTIGDLEASESAIQTAAHLQEVMEKGEDRFESQHRRKDGSIFDVEVSVQYQPTDGRMVVFLHNITERKRAEEMLKRERDLRQSIMDGAGNSHLVYLDCDFNFVMVNDTYAKVCGYRPEEMIGKNHFVLYPHAGNEEIFTRVRDTGEPFIVRDKPFEFPDQPERGITYWDWTLSPVKDSTGLVSGLVYSLFETTARKRAEQEMALIADIGQLIGSTLDIEEVYERVALQIKQLIFFDNVNVNLYDEQQEMMQVIYSAGEKMPGRMVGDTFPVRGSLVEEVIRTRRGVIAQPVDPEDLVKRFPRLISFTHAGMQSMISVPLISRDRVIGNLAIRSKKPFAFTERDLSLAEKIGLQIAGAVANARLYAERKRAEQEMAMLAEIGRVIGSTLSIEEVYDQFATMTKQIIGFDLLSVNVPDIRNNSFRVAYTFGSVMPERTVGHEISLLGTMTGYVIQTREPSIFQFSSFEEMNDKYPQLTREISIRSGFFSNMLVPLLANDAIVGVLHFWARQHNAYGDREVRLAERVGMQIAGAIKNAALFADRNRAEEEKERLQAQLIQAQKMESVGRLAGGVAHDFNNMVGVIIGHLDLAKEQIDASHPLQSNLQGIRRAAERSAELTQQLLAFARKQVISPKVIDLNETVEGSLKMLRRLIGEDIDLVWMPRAGLSSVNVDPAQIGQVLTNLCVNARDAIAGVGKVTIETDDVTFDAGDHASNPDFVPGDYVMLAVSDNGCGMGQETVEKLFEPFFTTKEVGKGTGLGLPMIYGIVKQNHGFIDVYSELGIGTTFKIYLPRHQSTAEQLALELPEVPSARGEETILLVEDEPEMLAVVTMLLRRQGYTVMPAPTPSEAIRLAGEYQGGIDLLITDVVMPEMNGKELAQALQRRHPKLKRLFMSGYTADVIAHHGVLDEGVHFIQKPFSIADIAAKVRAALVP